MPFGVSNSFKRGTVKTYSRQRARLEHSYDVQRPRKRICMAPTGEFVEQNLNPGVARGNEGKDATDDTHVEGPILLPSLSDIPSSSPTSESPPIFSSDPAPKHEESELSTPPSSPPAPVPSPGPTIRKPAFSFLKRKITAGQEGSAYLPLSETAHNIRKMPAAKRAKTQTQIDLGGENRKTCRVCGMEYIPSVKQDSTLHKEFCGMNVSGIELGKQFLKDESLKLVASEKADRMSSERVVLVDRRSSASLKTKVKKVLSVVNTELSAAEIEEDSLWGFHRSNSAERHLTGRRKGQQHLSEVRDDRFKAFLYLVGDRCIGFCLAEKISEAFRVAESHVEKHDQGDAMLAAESSSISCFRSAELALLGISRIWVSKSFRGKGLALELIKCTQNNFFYGVEIPKTLMAFSQPTESGGRLARKWFGPGTDWRVYQSAQS